MAALRRRGARAEARDGYARVGGGCAGRATTLDGRREGGTATMAGEVWAMSKYEKTHDILIPVVVVRPDGTRETSITMAVAVDAKNAESAVAKLAGCIQRECKTLHPPSPVVCPGCM